MLVNKVRMIGEIDLMEPNGGVAPLEPALVGRLEELAGQAQEREIRITNLEIEQQTRFSELAELTRRLITAEAELERTQNRLAEEIAQREKLLQSASWRVTAPLRRLKGMLRRG